MKLRDFVPMNRARVRSHQTRSKGSLRYGEGMGCHIGGERCWHLYAKSNFIKNGRVRKGRW